MFRQSDQGSPSESSDLCNASDRINTDQQSDWTAFSCDVTSCLSVKSCCDWL